MQALDYWKAVTADRAGFLDRLLAILKESGVRYCVIGGQAVNAYVEPVVSLDLDVAVALADLPTTEAVLAREFRVDRFAHRVNVSAPGSDLRVQLQTEPRYAAFVEHTAPGQVLGLTLPVARLEDVLQARCGRPRMWNAGPASDRRTSPTSRDCWKPTQTFARSSPRTS